MPRIRWLRVARNIAFGYVVLFGWLALMQRSMLYQPFDGPTDPAHAGLNHYRAENFRSTDGATIPYWLHESTRKNAPLVLYFHGNGGGLHAFTAPLALLADMGVSVAAMEYRGYPGAPPHPSEAALVADAAALARLLHTRMPSRPLIIWGYSLGSGVAVQTAYRLQGNIPIAKVVLEAPFTSVANRAQELFPLFPVRLVLRDQYNSVDTIAKLPFPITILHGTADTIIPYPHGQALYAAANHPKQMITLEGGDHFDLLPRLAAGELRTLLQQP